MNILLKPITPFDFVAILAEYRVDAGDNAKRQLSIELMGELMLKRIPEWDTKSFTPADTAAKITLESVLSWKDVVDVYCSIRALEGKKPHHFMVLLNQTLLDMLQKTRDQIYEQNDAVLTQNMASLVKSEGWIRAEKEEHPESIAELMLIRKNWRKIFAYDPKKVDAINTFFAQVIKST